MRNWLRKGLVSHLPLKTEILLDCCILSLFPSFYLSVCLSGVGLKEGVWVVIFLLLKGLLNCPSSMSRLVRRNYARIAATSAYVMVVVVVRVKVVAMMTMRRLLMLVVAVVVVVVTTTARLGSMRANGLLGRGGYVWTPMMT